jgi:hypothetical protein
LKFDTRYSTVGWLILGHEGRRPAAIPPPIDLPDLMGGVDIDETSPSILAVFRSIGFS